MTVAKQIECPSCGAKLKGGECDRLSCEFCGADLELQTEGKPGGWDPPLFRRRPIPCPSCSKKALRPRVRTKDFRCQACAAVYPGQEIEKRIERLNWRDEVLLEAPKKIALVVRGLLRRSVPEFAKFPLPPKPKPSQSDPGTGGTVIGFVSLATMGVAYFALGSLSTGLRIGIAIGAGFLVGFVIVQFWFNARQAEERAAEAAIDAERRPAAEWADANAAVASLRDKFHLLGFEYALKGTACSDEQLSDAQWVERQYADPELAREEPSKAEHTAADNAVSRAFEPSDTAQVLMHCRHPAQRWAVHHAHVANPAPESAKQGTSRVGLVALMRMYDQLHRVGLQKDIVVAAVKAAGSEGELSVVENAYADLEEARGIS